jgi:hypothetical protein
MKSIQLFPIPPHESATATWEPVPFTYFLTQTSSHLLQTRKMEREAGPHSLTRGVRSAVWFGFEYKSHPNREIKMYAVRFGSVDF